MILASGMLGFRHGFALGIADAMSYNAYRPNQVLCCALGGARPERAIDFSARPASLLPQRRSRAESGSWRRGLQDSNPKT
jgi:hypothetical protein